MLPPCSHERPTPPSRNCPGGIRLLLSGPRQSGKTTISRAVFLDKPYVSLEDLDAREFAISDPRRFLARYPDGAILDEVQRAPELFSYLQTRADLDGRMGLFILTSSQQFGVLSGITQSLAGRVGLVQLLPFSAGELLAANKLPETLDQLLFMGGFRPSMIDCSHRSSGTPDTSPPTWNGTCAS